MEMYSKKQIAEFVDKTKSREISLTELTEISYHLKKLSYDSEGLYALVYILSTAAPKEFETVIASYLNEEFSPDCRRIALKGLLSCKTLRQKYVPTLLTFLEVKNDGNEHSDELLFEGIQLAIYYFSLSSCSDLEIAKAVARIIFDQTCDGYTRGCAQSALLRLMEHDDPDKMQIVGKENIFSYEDILPEVRKYAQLMLGK